MSERLSPESQTQLSPEQVFQAGAELLNHFGVEQDPRQDTDHFLEAIGQLQPRHKGERYLVRYELEQDQTKWPEETKEIITRAAEGMRMFEHQTRLALPPDALIVLGGARQSNLDRLRYPLEGGMPGWRAKDPAVVVVGSSRKLQDSEKENVANYAPEAETEFDLCAAAVRLLGSSYRSEVQLLHFGSESAGTPDVIDAAMTTFVQTGVLKANKYAKDLNGRVAAVTTQIYQTSTQLDLQRIAARYNITHSQTMGNPSDPNIIAKRTTATYLSEIVRTLTAAANAVKESKEVAEREEQDSKLAQAKSEYENDPDNWEVIAERGDGSRIVRKPSGEEEVIEKDGSSWTSYSSQSGLRYSGPDDQIGHYD